MTEPHRRRRRAPAITLGLLLVALTGCAASEQAGSGGGNADPSRDGTARPSGQGQARADASAPRWVGPPAKVVYVETKYARHFTTIADIVHRSDELLIGTITAERRGAIHGGPESPDQNRVLTVNVEQAIKGTPPDPVEVETLGWTFVKEQEYALMESDGLWLRVGDRVLMGLSTRSALRGPNTSNSFFLLGGGRLMLTGRKDPLVRQVEALSEPQLVARLREAAR